MSSGCDPPDSFEDILERDPKAAGQVAETIVQQISQTGEVRDVWAYLRPVLTYRLSRSLEVQFAGFDQEPYQLIVKRLHSFSNPPFTIQRLCELIAYPRRHYSRADKYLRALEKVLMVVSVVEPSTKHASPAVPKPTTVLEEGAVDSKGREEGAVDSRGREEGAGVAERKRPLCLTVELQEADSTMSDGPEPLEEAPPKRPRLEPGTLPSSEQGERESGQVEGLDRPGASVEAPADKTGLGSVEATPLSGNAQPGPNTPSPISSTAPTPAAGLGGRQHRECTDIAKGPGQEPPSDGDGRLDGCTDACLSSEDSLNSSVDSPQTSPSSGGPKGSPELFSQPFDDDDDIPCSQLRRVIEPMDTDSPHDHPVM